MTRPRAIVLMLAAATGAYLTAFSMTVQGQSAATEAPAGFDNLTNGFELQADFDADLAKFEERDDIARGLGPVYNAQSCAECRCSKRRAACEGDDSAGRIRTPACSRSPPTPT